MRHIMKLNRGMYPCLALVAFSGIANAGIIVLDDFDSTPNDGSLGERSFNSSIVDDPFSQGGNTVIDTAFEADGDVGALIMNSGVGVQQKASLTYGLDDGPIDLLSGGNTTFEFDFLEVDQDFTIRIVMLGGSGGKAVTNSLLVHAGVNQVVSVDIMNDFDFFSMDLSDVIDIQVELNNSFRDDDDNFVRVASLDFVLQEFRAVPAPGVLTLLGLGGVVAVRRKR